MNAIKILYLFLGFFCVENGYAKSNIECAPEMTAIPPEANTECCGHDVAGSKLIDGPEAAINQYPWLALIEYTRRGKLEALCGGTLISGKYVLTAAHCVTGIVLKSATPTNIRLGDYNTTNDGPDCVSKPDFSDCTEGETRIPIEKIIPHPQFETSQISRPHDIALIKMKKSTPYTDFIRPICLPTEDVTLKTGPLNFIFAGWGTAIGPSSVKQHLNLPFVTRDKCESQFLSRLPNFTLGKGQLCAGGEKGKDACKGSGGLPLMYDNGGKYHVVGLASFGLAACGTENVSSVYTNVFEYSSWISSNIIP